MAVVIQKFGGKLLETPEKIRQAAEFIIATKEQGEDPVVVVSAPGSMTDRIIESAREISSHPDKREMDMMLSVGERMAMSLLAIAINDDNRYKAVSYTGSQIGIITDNQHTEANIIEVKGYRLKEALQRGEIPIVAGFQGVSTEREITTLGRGGSDTTAVSLSVVLDADRCELIKDCGGIYSADPDLVENATPILEIDYETLEAVAAAGAKVVHSRAISLAKEHNVKLSIRGLENILSTIVTEQDITSQPVTAVVLEEDLFSIPLTEDPGNNWTHFFRGNGTEFLISRQPSNEGDKKTVSVLSIVGSHEPFTWSHIDRIIQELDQIKIRPIAINGFANKICLIIEEGEGKKSIAKVHDTLLELGLIEN